MSTIDISDNLSVLLLAAGGSTRLGQSKQLLRCDGETLVALAARRLLTLNPAELIVVTGSVAGEVERQVASLPLKIVRNPHWQEGLGTSISAGVNQLSITSKGVLIFLCDQFLVDQEDMKLLGDTWSTDISRLVAASWETSGRKAFGPPVIFPRELFFELKSLKGDQGGRHLIEKYQDRVTFVSLEHAAVDLDTPGDLEKMIRPG